MLTFIIVAWLVSAPLTVLVIGRSLGRDSAQREEAGTVAFAIHEMERQF